MTDFDDENVMPQAKIVGKYEKSHNRGIIGIWSFRFGGKIGVMTVAHDSAKLWLLTEKSSDEVTWEETMVLDTWRSAVQSADVSNDGTYAVIVGINSVVHEVMMTSSVENEIVDFGYLEAVFVAIRPDKRGYVTGAYSGVLKDMDANEEKPRKAIPFPTVKSISCLKYSLDGKYVAVGQLDGAIDLLDAETFKSAHKYETHSMRIRKLEFLPCQQRFLSACDDRLIKLHSLVDFNEADPSRSTKALRVYSAHDAPVTGLTLDERSGGTRFASSSSSAQIFIWHIEMTAPIISVANEHSSTISALSFTPSGCHLVSGGDDGMVHIYSVPGYGGDSPSPQKRKINQIEQDVADMSYEEPQKENSPIDMEPEPEQEHQFGEYHPYAEPRTPPQEEEEDIGDLVYAETEPTQQYNLDESNHQHELQ